MLRVVSKWNLISKQCLSCSMSSHRSINRRKETVEKLSGRKRKKIAKIDADKIAKEAYDDFFADLRSEAETKRLLFSKTKYIVNLKLSSAPMKVSQNAESKSLLAEIENNSVWVSETLPSSSRLRLHMMGETFFKATNLQKNIEAEEFKLKTGFFRTCTIMSAITGVLPILATKLTGEELPVPEKMGFLVLVFSSVWLIYRSYLNRLQIIPCVYFDDTTGVTSIPLRSNQTVITPTQAENVPNLFMNIPPILSNPNEVLMTPYSQEIMAEKSFILEDQLGKDGKLVQEYFPHFIAAKLAATSHLKGIGNKNFPVAVLYDDWLNVHPKTPTKGLAVLPMIPPSQMSKILDDPLWSNTDFGRRIAENSKLL